MSIADEVKRRGAAVESRVLPHDPYYEAAPWQLRALLWASLAYALSVAAVEISLLVG